MSVARGRRRFGPRARVRPHRWWALLGGAATPTSPITAGIGKGRLVVVAPHPDDEVLACGGLLVHAQAAGWPVLVVAVTAGERSHGAATPGRRLRLARQRGYEQRRSVAALGMAAATLRALRLPDGGVTRQAALLERRLTALFAPGDTVVVTSHCDGHPDHEASGRAASAAARRIGCTVWEAPVWLWQWAQPGAAGPHWGQLGRVELGRTALRRKALALRRHRSQQRRGAAGQAVLCRDIRRRAAWPVEFFFEPPHADA